MASKVFAKAPRCSKFLNADFLSMAAVVKRWVVDVISIGHEIHLKFNLLHALSQTINI